MKTIITTTVLMAAFGMFSQNVQAGHGADELTHVLRDQAADACREIRRTCWDMPDSRHLYRDVYEVYRQANHIYTAFHRGESLRHLNRDLSEIDELLHHAEELAEKMRKHEDRHSRRSSISFGHYGGFSIRFGQSGHRRSSHGRSSHTRHLKHLEDTLEEMTDTLHDLMDEVNYRKPVKIKVQPPLPVPAP